MKMKVIRINATNRSGTSKSGNPYHIDQTEITVQVPYSSPEGFGFKEMTYQYGDSSQIAKLMPLRDNLPAECDIDLGVSPSPPHRWLRNSPSSYSLLSTPSPPHRWLRNAGLVI